MCWFILFFSVFIQQDNSFKSRIAMFNNSSAKEPPADPFKTEDPFKSDLFKGLNTFLYLFIIYSCISVRIVVILCSASCCLLVITYAIFISLWISISTKYLKCTYIIDAKLWFLMKWKCLMFLLEFMLWKKIKESSEYFFLETMIEVDKQPCQFLSSHCIVHFYRSIWRRSFQRKRPFQRHLIWRFF